MTAEQTRTTPRATLTCSAWDSRLHRAGTKAAAGRCSWTETCENPLRYSVEVRYADTGRCTTEDPQAPMPSNHRHKWDPLVSFARSGPVDVRLVASGARWRLLAELHDGRLSLRSIEG